MSKIGLWKITQNGPVKLIEGSIDLEKQLEDWIEKDPSLLQHGLKIVGRQISVEGGRLDLLAIDPMRRWVVIEIKAGPIYSDVIGQVMYYASSIARMSDEKLESKIKTYLQAKGLDFKTILSETKSDEESLESKEERDVFMMLVGRGEGEGIKETLSYFYNKYGIPISLFSFDVFSADEGIRILTRELTDRDFPNIEAEEKKTQRYSIENVCTIADRAGIGQAFRKLLEAAQKNGLFPRPYARSIMYTPPQRHDRMLFTVWVDEKSKNKIRAYIGSDVFSEFYPISEEEAKSIFGPIGWREMTERDVIELIDSLNRFFDGIKEPKK